MTTAIPFVQPQIRLASWTSTMQRSMLRQMIAVVGQPGILSFAGGLPAPELFPVEDYTAALARVLSTDRGSLQYGPPYLPLKHHIVGLMAQRGVTCRPEQVFLTTGAQQALAVLSRLLLDNGGEVLLEGLVYTGIQQAIAPMRPRVLSLTTDLQTGVSIADIQNHLEAGARPAFLYLIPDAHNPLGVSISPEKRQTLLALSAENHLTVIEDDPYGLLTFGEDNPPPLRASGDEHVFYVGSFSKILAPALRLGWTIVPEHLVPQLTVVKEAGDLESSALTQRAVSAYLDSGRFPDHLRTLRTAYRERRDAMLEALAAHMPDGCRWSEPQGGMFIWVELPGHVDAMELLETAVEEEKVAFIPGQAFALPGVHAGNYMRLNYSNCCIADIHEGIERLGRVVAQSLEPAHSS